MTEPFALYSRYNKGIQTHPTQIAAIAGAILSSGSACNFLVFGVGNDSGLWMDINRAGRTVFLEDDKVWARKARKKYDGINIKIVDYSASTVESSLIYPDDIINSTKTPNIIKEHKWDVILIDGPRGYQPAHPGRALPIIWASKVRKKKTHIFVDDYHRRVEKYFSDRLLFPKSNNCAVIPRRPKSTAEMLWCIGNPIPDKIVNLQHT